MEIKPIIKTKDPGYPTLFIVAKNPSLLSKNVPGSWIKNRYAATSLAVFMCYACNNSNSTKEKTDKATIVATPAQKQNTTEKAPPPPHIKSRHYLREKYTIQAEDTTLKSSMKVAPVFVHGDGSGGIGCIAMSPPVFISEEEAKVIITDEFKKAGIVFGNEKLPVFNIKAPAIADECPEKHKGEEKFAKIKLKMDGYNKEYNLAFEYVSTRDYDLFQPNVGENGVMCSSSAQSYDTKLAAEIIRQKLKSNTKAHIGVFYDPLTSIKSESENWKISREKAILEAKENLIAQVSDFIAWIKKEGIIKE